MVGDPERYVVLRAVGSDRLLSARSPMTGWSRRRWTEAFEPGDR